LVRYFRLKRASSVTVYSCMRSASLMFVVEAYAFEGMAVTAALVFYKIDPSDQDKVAVPK